MVEPGEVAYARWGRLAVFFTPAIVSGTAKMEYGQFALWNLLAAFGLAVEVATSAYGIGRVVTGHDTLKDVGILVLGLGVGALVAVIFVQRGTGRDQTTSAERWRGDSADVPRNERDKPLVPPPEVSQPAARRSTFEHQSPRTHDARVTFESQITVVHPLHLPYGSSSDGSDPVVISPESAGCQFAGLRIVELPAGRYTHPPHRSRRDARAPARRSRIGRLRRDDLRSSSDGPTCSVARATSPTCPSGPRPPSRPRPAGDVHCSRRAGACVPAPACGPPAAGFSVELAVRAGLHVSSTISVIRAPSPPTNSWPVEDVLTPAGNWSSWPPHKHDTAGPDEAVLEEIYYYEMASTNRRCRHPADGRWVRDAAAVHDRRRHRPLRGGAPSKATWC